MVHNDSPSMPDPPATTCFQPRSVSESYGRSEEHTSELQSQSNLVCRLLLEKKTQPTHLAYPEHGRLPATRPRAPLPCPGTLRPPTSAAQPPLLGLPRATLPPMPDRTACYSS